MPPLELCSIQPSLLETQPFPISVPSLSSLLISCFSPVRLCATLRHPTRLLCPWDSPGKNTAVGCHFLPQCRKVKSESEVTQSCPTRATPRTTAYQAPPSMGFSRQEHWSGVPLPSPFTGIGLINYLFWERLRAGGEGDNRG